MSARLRLCIALGALAALGLAGCESRLPLDAGNGWRCTFDAPAETRDEACSEGWVCGVDNRCHEFRKDEIFPCEDLTGRLCPYPSLDSSAAAKLYPAHPRRPVASVHVERRSDGYVVGARPAAESGMGPQPVARMTPGCLRHETPLPVPTEAGAPAQVLNMTLPGAAGELAVFLNPNGNRLFTATRGAVREGATPIERVSAIRPMLPTAAGAGLSHLGLVLQDVVPAGTEDGLTRRKRVGRLTLQNPEDPSSPVTFEPFAINAAGTAAIRDARVLHTANAAVPVLLMDDQVRWPCVIGQAGCIDAGAGEGWMEVLTPAPEGWRPSRLSVSPNAETWAVVTERLEGGRLEQQVAVWRLRQLDFTELASACTPCAAGRIDLAVPFSAQGGGVDVVCRSGTGAATKRELVRVVGAAGGVCELEQVAPLFDPMRVTAYDDGLNFPVLGMVDGSVLLGAELAHALPVFLDRMPTTVTEFEQDGEKRLVAVTDAYMAVEVPGFGMVAVAQGPSQQRPSAVVNRLPGGFIFPGGVTAVLERVPGAPPSGTCTDPAAPSASLGLKFGPTLLGPTGQLAEGPYLAEVLATEAGQGLVAVAGDSLYFEPDLELERALPTLDEGLTAQLTPEPNFPIRAIAVDQSPGVTNPSHPYQLFGYLVTSRRLFEFSLSKSPVRWALEELQLGGGEPAGVAMLSDGHFYGRVVYRDGNVFTLPRGFQLIDGNSMGEAARITSFVHPYPEHTVEGQTVRTAGLPLALTERGVFVGTPPSAGPDTAAGERYRLWTWTEVEVPEGHAGFEHGRLVALGPDVYLFDRAGAVVRLGRVVGP